MKAPLALNVRDFDHSLDFYRRMLGIEPSKVRPGPANVEPSLVRPRAVEVMREIGIDISGHRSKSVDEFLGREFDYAITVCDNASERCPVFPAKTRRIHWSFDDPAAGDAAAQLAVFRRVRDEIRARLREFIPAA